MSAKTHGKTKTPEYSVWTDIKTRCYNKNFKDYQYYGGRGIGVCDRWKNSFENFYADMGKRPTNSHSIDRINFNLDYSPENCRWATNKDQVRNRRNTVIVEIGGISKPLPVWCEEKQSEYKATWLRYKEGIRGEDLFFDRSQKLTLNGVTDTISGWSKRTKIKASTITMRINKYKWPTERALTQETNRARD